MPCNVIQRWEYQRYSDVPAVVFTPDSGCVYYVDTVDYFLPAGKSGFWSIMKGDEVIPMGEGYNGGTTFAHQRDHARLILSPGDRVRVYSNDAAALVTLRLGHLVMGDSNG